jgi:hypothetical protein
MSLGALCSVLYWLCSAPSLSRIDGKTSRSQLLAYVSFSSADDPAVGDPARGGRLRSHSGPLSILNLNSYYFLLTLPRTPFVISASASYFLSLSFPFLFPHLSEFPLHFLPNIRIVSVSPISNNSKFQFQPLLSTTDTNCVETEKWTHRGIEGWLRMDSLNGASTFILFYSVFVIIFNRRSRSHSLPFPSPSPRTFTRSLRFYVTASTWKYVCMYGKESSSNGTENVQLK